MIKFVLPVASTVKIQLASSEQFANFPLAAKLVDVIFIRMCLVT